MDITPFSIGIETGDIKTVLVDRNSTIPLEKVKFF